MTNNKKQVKKNRSKYYYKVNSQKSNIINKLDNKNAKIINISHCSKNNTNQKNDKHNKNNPLQPILPTSAEINNLNNQFIHNITQRQQQQPPMFMQPQMFIQPMQHMNNMQQPGLFGPMFSGTLIIKKQKEDSHNKDNESNQNSKNIVSPPPIFKKKFVSIDEDVDNIDDILNIISKYPIKNDIEYSLNMDKLSKIKPSLIKLKNMIGMDKLKKNILYQIFYYLQDLHTGNQGDFLHTCIYGPPGTGKTEIAKIIGEIFAKIGILKKGTFKKVTRNDLVAGYLGQTAIKTTNIIKQSLGGVLFIDEAYSLGNKEDKDIFSKECIDTLCEALSNHKHELMVIIAGYEKELNSSFFSRNSGLESRFNWRYNIEKYNEKELQKIFFKKIVDNNWYVYNVRKTELKNIKSFNKIEDDVYKRLNDVFNIKWFKDNMKYFKYYGRDMEVLFTKIKVAHAKRVIKLHKNDKKVLTKEDLENGMKLFLDNDDVKKRGEDLPMHLYGMYS